MKKAKVRDGEFSWKETPEVQKALEAYWATVEQNKDKSKGVVYPPQD